MAYFSICIENIVIVFKAPDSRQGRTTAFQHPLLNEEAKVTATEVSNDCYFGGQEFIYEK